MPPCVRSNLPEILKMALAQGLPRDGLTPLMLACDVGDHDIIRCSIYVNECSLLACPSSICHALLRICSTTFPPPHFFLRGCPCLHYLHQGPPRCRRLLQAHQRAVLINRPSHRCGQGPLRRHSGHGGEWPLPALSPTAIFITLRRGLLHSTAGC